LQWVATYSEAANQVFARNDISALWDSLQERTSQAVDKLITLAGDYKPYYDEFRKHLLQFIATKGKPPTLHNSDQLYNSTVTLSPASLARIFFFLVDNQSGTKATVLKLSTKNLPRDIRIYIEPFARHYLEGKEFFGTIIKYPGIANACTGFQEFVTILQPNIPSPQQIYFLDLLSPPLSDQQQNVEEGDMVVHSPVRKPNKAQQPCPPRPKTDSSWDQIKERIWDAGVNVTNIIDTVVNDIKDSEGVTSEVMHDVRRDLADVWDEFVMVCL
jgi:hypothetical protein